MRNLLMAEFLKLKKDTMFFTGTIITVLVPVFLILKDNCLSVPPYEITEWVMSYCVVTFMVLSVLSGFIITNLVHKEYQAGTVVNILSSAVSRTSFVCCKLVVWFLWYAVMLACIEGIVIFGGYLIYPDQFQPAFVKMVIVMFSECGLLSFISFLPLLFITVLQRKLFYPSILAAIGFTGLFMGGFNISAEMILPASVIPWTAVPLAAVYRPKSPYLEIEISVILLTGFVSLFFVCRSFRRQDQ